MQVLTVDSAGQIRRELQPLEALVLARETQGNGNGWGERCLFCYDNYNVGKTIGGINIIMITPSLSIIYVYTITIVIIMITPSPKSL
jgi:hypothetical protein